MSVTITGASDDLIEIDGDIYEEFPAPTIDREAGGYIACSDGTILQIQYLDGVWRIHLIVAGQATLVITPAPANDDTNYSDVAVLDGHPVKWVVLGINWASADPAGTVSGG
jgi:hypothetical protein